MFKKMRKSHMNMEVEDIKVLLKDSEYGIISTMGEDGYPYGFPMSYVYLNNYIYFHCGLKGHKIDNILYNNRVSMTVVGESSLIPELLDTNYKSIVLFGKIFKVSDEEEKITALREIVKKYAKGFTLEGDRSIVEEKHITNVFKIEIEHITGKVREDGKR